MGVLNDIIYRLADLTMGKAALIGLAIGGFYYFSFFDPGTPQSAKVEVLRKELAERANNLKGAEQARQNAEKFERDLEMTRKQLALLLQFAPKDFSGPELLGLLNESASIGGLKLSKVEPSTKLERSGPFDLLKATVSGSGYFPNLMKFLSALTGMRRLLILDQLKLSAETAKTPGESPKLDVVATVVAFRYIGGAGKDSKPEVGKQKESTDETSSRPRAGGT